LITVWHDSASGNSRGLIKVLASFASAAGMIWREHDGSHNGISGQLEFVSLGGEATGRKLNVIVCGGEFDFSDACSTEWLVPLAVDRYRFLWESPLPVMVVVHDSVEEVSYWGYIDGQLRRDAKPIQYVSVPKDNVLQYTSSRRLLHGAVQAETACFLCDYLDLSDFMEKGPDSLKEVGVSFLDLFLKGLVNHDRYIKFDVDVVVSVLESGRRNCSRCGAFDDVAVLGFIKFLVAQDIAIVPYEDCLEDWYCRDIYPTFNAPLTRRGRELASRVKALIRT